jgi:hypothetical protein
MGMYLLFFLKIIDVTKQGFALIPGHYRSVDDSRFVKRIYPAKKADYP